MGADIHVIYIMVNSHILVMCVIRHSVNIAVLKNINAYIVVNALMSVMFVRKHSIKRSIL
jgi:hypothetical protein